MPKNVSPRNLQYFWGKVKGFLTQNHYTKTESDGRYYNKTDTYTKTEVDNAKIAKTSIVDDLASTDATKVLSAKQGNTLKVLADTKLSFSIVTVNSNQTFTISAGQMVIFKTTSSTGVTFTVNGAHLLCDSISTGQYPTECGFTGVTSSKTYEIYLADIVLVIGM